MTDSNFSWTVLIAVVILGGVYVDPVSTTRVQIFDCEGAVENGRCKGKLVQAGRVKFSVNGATNAVVMVVLDGQDRLARFGQAFTNCAVVNGTNWQCREGESLRLVMIDGHYSRIYQASYLVSQTVGISGLRYWASWAGMRITPSWRDL